MQMHITYDLQQNETGGQAKPLVIRGAKRVPLPPGGGELVGWKVGEFDSGTNTGKKVYGVRVRYRLAGQGETTQLIAEVPSHAQNVQVHLGSVPKEYEAALGSVV